MRSQNSRLLPVEEWVQRESDKLARYAAAAGVPLVQAYRDISGTLLMDAVWYCESTDEDPLARLRSHLTLSYDEIVARPISNIWDVGRILVSIQEQL